MEMAGNKNMETMVGVSSWAVCSIGMMLFNKLAVKVFPVECVLVGIQMAFTCLVMVVFCWRSIHIGSLRDVLRWSMVAPFFTGMLLTSILALKHAPMSLVITLRSLSPLLGLAIESFYPDPLKIDKWMIFSIGIMLIGTCAYMSVLPMSAMTGIGWVLLNNVFAVGDRLLQRFMLAKDQQPVDISKTGVTLLNNLEGMVPLFICAYFTGEFAELPAAVSAVDQNGWLLIAASCVVAVGISYTGIWAQSLITATSFLVLINANKFFVILFEVFVMSKSLEPIQLVGAVVTVLGGVLYGKARQQLDNLEAEAKPLLEAASK